MDKVIVAYWSQTGNTEEMANAIGKGIEQAGKTAEVADISRVSLEDLKASPSFALGCPSMGDEVLEEGEMEPFVAEVEKFCSGKSIALFGSYGWGDGQWMRDWVDRMKEAGATIVSGEGLITEGSPDAAIVDECIKLGSALAQL
jgi:flavodoxin short chain